MNIMVVGLGSMGKRRVRLLKKIADDFGVGMSLEIYGVDSKFERRTEAEQLFGIKTFDNLEDALTVCDAVVVSTSPLSHAEIIRHCLECDKHVFSEINLVQDGYDENIELAERKGKVLFLSSTFLYRRDVQMIAEKVKKQKEPVNYVYHVGQYLPDWHPWEKINDFFVSNRRTNGCREIFSIELPWLLEAFGDILSIKAIKGKNTELQVDYPDNYMVMLEHRGVNGKINKGLLAVDIMSRKSIRNLEVYNENLYLTWRGNPDELYEYNYMGCVDEKIVVYDSVQHQEGYSHFIIENAYYDELLCFLKKLIGENYSGIKYGFIQDKKILDIIDLIES